MSAHTDLIVEAQNREIDEFNKAVYLAIVNSQKELEAYSHQLFESLKELDKIGPIRPNIIMTEKEYKKVQIEATMNGLAEALRIITKNMPPPKEEDRASE